ncbi:unnamed protein product [Adineta ricciae]|nr:unnamed protein product [Adineta ricciae]
MTSSYRRDRSYSPYNHTNDDGENGCRIHVADLSSNCTKRDIEKAFNKWPIIEVWHAQASCFAFVVLRHRQDGQHAISELDGRCIGDARVRVSLARPRTRSHAGRNFDPNMRCYQCGSRGHFSRDCGNDQRKHKYASDYENYLKVWTFQKRPRSRSHDRRRERSYSRSRSRTLRDTRRYSPRRTSPSSNYESRANGHGYYTSPPRT